MDKEESTQVGCINPETSAPEIVRAYLDAVWPHPAQPVIISRETGLPLANVQKACQRLLKAGHIERPTGLRRGWYQGVPTVETMTRLESPDVRVHALIYHVIVSPKVSQSSEWTQKGGSPPSLYTHMDRRPEERDLIEYWEVNGYQYKVILQLDNEAVTVHLKASRRPLQEVELVAFESWLTGILQGLGVNVRVTELELVRAELNKDFELITITPKMLEIRDLRDKAWLRIYQKYRNLTRVEVGTTWKGDKALWDIFKSFGKREPSDPGEMFR